MTEDQIGEALVFWADKLLHGNDLEQNIAVQMLHWLREVEARNE